MIDAGLLDGKLSELVSDVSEWTGRISQPAFKRQAVTVLRETLRQLEAIVESDDATEEDDYVSDHESGMSEE